MESKVTEEQIEAITVAPRITKAIAEGAIFRTEFFTAADGVRGATPAGLRTNIPNQGHKLMTFCALTLKNQYTVIGKSACASPANFNQEIGQGIAKDNAMDEVYALLGYELRTKLHLIEQAGHATGKITTIGSSPLATYIGTKVVHAVPMNRADYNTLRGWPMPADENPEDEGYLVQYTDKQQTNVEGFTGYVSWSPRDVFEQSYDVGVTVKESTFVERLIKEFEELNEKFNKLLTFISTERFKGLPVDDQKDLKDQLTIMRSYVTVLKRRISKLSGTV